MAARSAKGWPIPNVVAQWQASNWYKQATAKKSNHDFYSRYTTVADSLLFSDVEEESILVTFVNSDKKMLNFIDLDENQGFFKYDRLLDKVRSGEILKVRFKRKSNDGLHEAFTVSAGVDEALRDKFLKGVEGVVRIAEGNEFGFVDDVFLHPTIVSKYKLTAGMTLQGQAMKAFDPKKGQWGWKMISVE